MIKIFSKVQNSALLHLILGDSDFNGRQEIIPDQNFLQLSTMVFSPGQKFAAHKHRDKDVNFSKFHAQESWVVLSGEIEVTFFDLDDSEISKHILRSGEVSITLRGGHSYRVLKEARVLEFKTGPYFGREADKIFL